jgi:hypothetical protein
MLIGVAGFFSCSYLMEWFEEGYWVPVFFIIVSFVALFLHRFSKNDFIRHLLKYLFSYGFMFTLFSFIPWFSDDVLRYIEFDTFLKGFIFIICSIAFMSLLAQFIRNGVMAIIDFEEWKKDAAFNFQKIAFAFISVLSVMYSIAGLSECGFVGFLSFMGLLAVFFPNLYDALTSMMFSESSSAPVHNNSSNEIERVKLDDGTVLKKESGHWMDDRHHEWKEESNGWEDKGFK